MKGQSRHGFQCIAESVKQKFNLFSTEGVPLRASLNVTFREYKTLDQQLKQLKLSSPDRTHGHVIQEDDALWRVASRYYNRPGEWREIADENEIEDPRRLTVGRVLRVPPL
jgi:nucleoid-associated protein YgaU